MRITALLAGLASVFPLAAERIAAPSPSPESKRPATQTVRASSSLQQAAAKRNENVQVSRIDTYAVRESGIRLGDNVTIVPLPAAEANYYATEHGRAPSEPIWLRTVPQASKWHGELYESHQNSVFNARSFFQAGPVQPSRQNNYGFRFGGGLRGLGDLTIAGSQRKIRGMVNGNVLVPLAHERTPRAADPAVRRLIERFLAAYPASLPNRPDFDERALNTNAPQRIDELNGSTRLDRDLGSKSRLSLSHVLNRQRVSAFQFVAGQNPDMEIHNQRAQMTWRYAHTAATEIALATGFFRNKSVLKPEPNAVGPRVRMGYQIEELGPDSEYPIDRAQNSYRWGGLLSHVRGGHVITAGADSARYQVNGIETANARGLIWFTSNFGRTAIENFLAGVPTTYEVTVGPMARGFRNTEANFFLADKWTINSRLQLYYGVRYNLVTAPREVNRLNTIPYGCDCNNVSPRFSVAYRARGWVTRASFTTSFGQILPVTYGQVRYNPPFGKAIQVQNPDLLNPLRGIDLNDPGLRYSPTLLAEELVSPYAHQYNLSFEREIARGYTMRAGYAGSRSFKLMNGFQENRAVPVPGIPLTTATVDARRPDPRFYEVRRVVNGGIAYLDAAQISLDAAARKGLAWGATYTFGKAIDQGADYTSTAANRDLSRARSQSMDNSFDDRKGLSNFDSPHALLAYWSYEIPRLAAAHSIGGWFLNDWQVSGSALAKKGTPLTLYVGSDAPGFGNVDGSPSDRPNILDPSILGKTISHPDAAPDILRRSRFAPIIPGESRGSLGRGSFRKAGIANVNAAVTKQWRWGSDRAFQFRAEAFNLSNTPQFDEPNRNLNATAFGKITNTLNEGRAFQLSLRLSL